MFFQIQAESDPYQVTSRQLAGAVAARWPRIGIDIQRQFRRNPQMMKTQIAVVAVALSFAAAVFCFGQTEATAPAASPAAAKSAKATAPKKEATKMATAMSPQMGTWKLNEAKSKLHPGMGKNTMVVYTEQKDKIKVTVDGVDKNEKPTHGVWIGKWDGKAYPAKGNMPWNSAAYKVVNDHTNDITTMKDGKIVWTGRITVAADGKSRTVTVNGTDANGEKFSTEGRLRQAVDTSRRSALRRQTTDTAGACRAVLPYSLLILVTQRPSCRSSLLPLSFWGDQIV